jgi:excisionase family DNA binding protein
MPPKSARHRTFADAFAATEAATVDRPTEPPMLRLQEPLLSVDEVARRLNCDRRTVRNLTIRGGLRFVRVGRLLRFRDAWVEDYIERSGR